MDISWEQNQRLNHDGNRIFQIVEKIAAFFRKLGNNNKDVIHLIIGNYNIMYLLQALEVHWDDKVSDRLAYLPYKMTIFKTIKKLIKNDAKLIIFIESVKIW